MSRTSKIPMVAVAPIVSVLVLAGCAQADGGDTSAGTIRYVDTGDILASYPRLQAETAGYFEDEGITIDNMSAIANASQIVQTVASGQADMALTGGTGPLALATTDKSVTVVAVVGAPAPLQVALNDEALGRLAADGITPDSPYEDKVAALEGAELGTYTTGSTTDLLFREALSTAGYDTDSHVTLQPFTEANAITTSAREDATDGLIAFPNQSTTPAADGWGEVFIDFQSEARHVVDVPYIVAIANPTFLEENPDVVEKFLTALTKARDDAMSLDADQRSALKDAYLAELSDEAWTAGLDAILPAFSNSLVPTEEQANQLQEVFNRTQDEPLDVDFDSLYDTSIVEGIPDA